MIHQLLITAVLDIDQGFEAEEALNAAIAVFALVLLVLTISTYRRTHLRSLLLVSAAFGLFAVQIAIQQFDAFVFAVGVQTDQIIVAFMELVILLLFFFAVVLRK